MISLILTTGYVSGQDSDDGNATLKVVHLSPNAEPLDISIDGESRVEELEYGSSSRYVQVEPGVREIDTNTRASQSFNFTSGRSYSFIVRNFAPSVESDIVSNQRSRVPNDLAQIRIAQFSPDLLDVDVSVDNGNSYSIDRLSYTEIDSYTRVSPGNYTVTVRNSRTDREVFSDEIKLRAGRTYTGFVAGSISRISDPGFKIVRVRETIQENGDEGNGRDGEDEEPPEEFVYRCTEVSEDPERIECRVYR